MKEYCINCKVEIHPKRVDILKKINKPMTCLEHSTTQRLVAFRATDDKTGDYIDIVTPEQAERLNKLQKNNRNT